MGSYKTGKGGMVIRTSDGANIPDDPKNHDRITFNAWVAAGNTPDPADPNGVAPTLDEIYDRTIQTDRVLKALVLALNDGSFPVGTNKTNAQLKAIIKAKM